MTAEAWVRRLAAEFWAAAGAAEPFPRDLEAPTLWALPLAVVKLPRLGPAAVRDWLRQQQLANHPALQQPERHLHGCLIAYAGEGVVFLDGGDPPAERRLSLAHEVAHFLADYRAPRARAVRRLGPAALAALDNRRAPGVEERVAAALVGVSLVPHVHLLARGSDGEIERAFVHGAEWRARRLALELLAPADAVRARLCAAGAPAGGPALVRALADLLTGEFGLPGAVARRYVRELAGPAGEPSAREWLGL